jgi:C4-dicarboxylate-binding protein DctP
MLNKLDKLGVVGLAFWDSGFKQLSANRPLRTLDDLAGLKFRIQPSSVIYSTMTAFGGKHPVNPS